MTDAYPTVTCPKCQSVQIDMDGFGFLACIPGCGYCTHPSLTDDVCGICGETVEKALPCAECGEMTKVWYDGSHLCWRCRA